MTATQLSTVTTDVIESYGNIAKNVIRAYRAGGERLVGSFEKRWENALDESRPQLAKDVARNASNAQKVFGAYTIKGITVTANGADTVVESVVRLAEKGVAQVAANVSLFEEKTGVTTLNTLAQAAVPAAQTVSKVFGEIEKKSAALAQRAAGAKAKPAKRATARKPRARKATAA